ncbi:hypothetical protein CWT12_09625 [Actinomyces sp. 432]|nr:hypothetical protein CWT12_09625 [Actinomyces sp. 432]
MVREDQAADRAIGATSRHLQLSPHALRYYEHVGLATATRDSVGHRRRTPATIRRLLLLTRMQASGGSSMGARANPSSARSSASTSASVSAASIAPKHVDRWTRTVPVPDS